MYTHVYMYMYMYSICIHIYIYIYTHSKCTTYETLSVERQQRGQAQA